MSKRSTEPDLDTAPSGPGRDRQVDLLRNRLRSQQLRLRAVVDNLGHGLSLYDRQGRLVLCNQQFLDIYRLPAQLGKAGTSFRRILEARVASNTHVGEDGQGYVADRIGAVREQRPIGIIQRLNSGQMISVTHQPMAAGGWVSTHRDVTELYNMQAELTHLAYHDPLTGLPNRTLFYQRMAQAFAGIAETGGFAVLYLDLDGFKPINDMLGHATGDALLRQFAARLGRALGPGDTAARMGGDEFAILHLGGDEESALDLAHKLAELCLQPFDFDGEVVSIAVGVGIAHAPAHGADTDALLHSADLALYSAKRGGRGGIRAYAPDLDRAAGDRRRLEAELRRAVENGEFELHYQPILDLAAGSFAGFEALIRWQHPERGLIPPGEFIPVAEEAGLIVTIGEWALREAFTEAARWPAELRVAVNVSTIQLRRGNLVATVMHALAASGLPPGRAEIEITESVFLEHSAQSLDALRQLRALGIRVALDDFGTGFSALSYLLAFPFDKLKIDGSFVRALAASDGAATIVSAVARIGARLGMSTTAEGIETPDQLRAVHAAGYAEAQGFLISRPLTRDAVRAMLNARFDQMPEPPAGQREAG
ncbi:MAG: putative bifunctional diguanylate cyclase/phosphodiesterase [Devosia sp.]